MKTKSIRRDQERVVVREFPPIEAGKYKIRLLRGVQASDLLTLDVREWSEGKNFRGFTRRGVRITSIQGLVALRDTIGKIIDEARDKFVDLSSGPAAFDVAADRPEGS